MIADVIAYDRDDHPILIAEVKAYEMAEADVSRAIERMEIPERWADIRFLMLVDYGRIRVIELVADGSRPVVLDLPTAEILERYDEEIGEMFQKRGIYQPYLERLIEGWLRDLAYHWKSPNPPASADMERIGLAPLLERGTTRSEVELEPDPVR